MKAQVVVNVNTYLISVVKKYSISSEDCSNLISKIKPLYREIRKWGNDSLLRIMPSGSFAKGTVIRGTVDIDLLISFKNQTPYTLEVLFESLYEYFNQNYFAKKQNVSIGIVYQGMKIDLVPAKKMPNATYPHSIYVSKYGTWTKTNIHKHISLIKKSPHKNVIKLLKIWRELHRVDFPSFLLELVVLEALKGKGGIAIDKRFLMVLKYLVEKFRYNKIYDPANTNNVVSDIISNEEKDVVIHAALASYNSRYWENIVWGLYEKKELK